MRVPTAIKLQPDRNARHGPSVAPGDPGPITFAPVTAFNPRRAVGRAATLVVALGLLSLVRPVAAQQGAAVGAQVGYSRADLTGINSNLVESRQGAITGVYLHLPVNGVISVRPEVLFSVKGGQILTSITGSDDLALVNLELAYLELPVLGRLTLPRGRYRPAIFGGPTVGVQIGCDLLITPVSGGDEVNGTCGENVTGISEWDFGWIAGAAIEMHLTRVTLSLQGRYTKGLRSVVDGPVELKNRGVAVLFGLTF
jgi:hypothetical protein